MAALTKKYASAGETPVLKGYRIHEEQIRNVARSFRELYQARRPDSLRAGSADTGNVRQTEGKTGSAFPVRVQKTVWQTRPAEGSVLEGQDYLVPKMETPNRTITAIRCYRCGVDFPVADFLYAKKSGLCIDCWEEMVV
jgi:hypothetical protein